jgi:glycosyltransferase involved in cell wall biosynthesis
VNRISPRLPGSEATPRLAFVTVGDTGRRTGGYLYHAEVFARLGEMGVTVEEIVPCGASMEEQERAASRPGSLLDPSAFDVIVVDALARIVCAPHLDRWREKRPVVAMIHELPGVANPEEAGREYKFEMPLLRSNLLVCVSEHGKSILEERGIPDDCLRIVPPGFDRISRADAGSPDREDGTLRVLCVGQWIPRKGILDLVRAWTAHERSGATLELVGETDADSGYTAAIREAISGGESIVVRGSVDDATLAEAYAAADFFALPSRYEGYGIVLAEALAYGLPVVACDVGPPFSSRRARWRRSPRLWTCCCEMPRYDAACPERPGAVPKNFRAGTTRRPGSWRCCERWPEVHRAGISASRTGSLGTRSSAHTIAIAKTWPAF